MNAARLVLGACALLLLAWFLFQLFLAPAGPRPEGPTVFRSSSECAACHVETHAQWQGSQHAQAWINPAVRALSNDFQNADCIDCHAPRPVFETGIGKRVLPRSARRAEGVDCLSCHLLPDGRMAGTRTVEDAPCRPVATPELSSPEFCAGCHDQHATVQQWRASQWPARGEDCHSCHLPPLQGGGRDHSMRGGHDLALVASAVELRARREGTTVVIELENVRAGHAFPTDERSRAADLFWRPLPAAGGEPGPWRHLWRFRDPYRHEVDIARTLLDAHERKALVLDAPEARGALEVALFYKRSPYWEDPERPEPEREAFLLHQVELAALAEAPR